MPLCTVQPPAELSPQMSQHAMFWTLPALDTGQTVLPMVSGSRPSSTHRPFGSNNLMTQPQTPSPPPPPPRQPDIQRHFKTQPPSGHATYVNGEQGTYWTHGSTMPIWHTDPSCSVTAQQIKATRCPGHPAGFSFEHQPATCNQTPTQLARHHISTTFIAQGALLHQEVEITAMFPNGSGLSWQHRPKALYVAPHVLWQYK